MEGRQAAAAAAATAEAKSAARAHGYDSLYSRRPKSAAPAATHHSSRISYEYAALRHEEHIFRAVEELSNACHSLRTTSATSGNTPGELRVRGTSVGGRNFYVRRRASLVEDGVLRGKVERDQEMDADRLKRMQEEQADGERERVCGKMKALLLQPPASRGSKVKHWEVK